MMGNLTFKILNPRTQPIQMRNINNLETLTSSNGSALGLKSEQGSLYRFPKVRSIVTADSKRKYHKLPCGWSSYEEPEEG
jgi:hypothetical protein